jgi:predicted alpha/beta superfamily hydrolase
MLIDRATNILNRLKYLTLSGVLLFGLSFNGIAYAADKNRAELLHTYSTPYVQIIQHDISAPTFKQNVRVQVFLPPNYSNISNLRYPSLYINDGQDAGAITLSETLQKLYTEQKIGPVIVIAVTMLSDRMGAYGFSDRKAKHSMPAETRYGQVGLRAHEYSEWLVKHVVPFIDAHYRTRTKPEARTILGWSLGAGNAFNIAWNYPDVFSRVGGFSPSFWLSAKSGDISQSLAMTLINSKPIPRHFSIWLAAGTAEEIDDRDGDGLIDVLDDAQDVINALNAKVRHSKRRHDFSLTQLEGGQHNQASWKLLLPVFLQWAYPVISQ